MSNINDTEIQRLFEEAKEKAVAWEMPDDTRRASTDSITTEFLEELAEEEAANSIPQKAADSTDSNPEPSDASTEKQDQPAQEQDEIMSQEDIEALITNSKTEKTIENPPENSTETSSEAAENEEALSKSDIKEMFEEQSSAVSKPETEVETQTEQSEETENISTESKKEEETSSENLENETPNDDKNEADLTSDQESEETETNSEESNQTEGPLEDDLEALIKKKKAQQQQAKSDMGEMDIAALFSNEANNEASNSSDPTSVLSQDDFSQKENIVDNQSNVINSQNVLEDLLSKTQAEQKTLEDDDGIMSDEQVSEMLQSTNNDSATISNAEGQPNNPFSGQNSSTQSQEQFPAANKVEKNKNRKSWLKWLLTFITGIAAVTSVIAFWPDIQKVLEPKPKEFKNPAASWSWEKNSNTKSSIKYKIFVPGMSLMLSSIDAGKSSDINKLNADMIKRAYERRLKQNKLKKFRMLNETQYLREAGDNLRMINFDYALETNDNRTFIKKSVYLGVGDRLFKLDFTSRAESIDEPSDGPAWSKLEKNFRSALGLKDFKRNKEVYIGNSFENFKKASEYFATRAMGLNP